MDINPDRLLGDLAELSTIGGRADGGVDRVAWGAADLRGRQWLKGKLEAAGWHAFTDPALNVFGRASDVRRRRLLIGSHTDSVAAGGRLDGAYGVVAALEVVRVLAETADPAAEQVELVDFADEEGVRFPCGYFGAKALTGALDVQQLVGAGDVLREAGVEIADAQRASEHLQDVAGFIELHIEQGPRLEAEHASVAVVSGILGFDRYRIDIGGRAGHGGTTPFELRHDPVQAAAAFVAEVPSIVRRIDDAGTATVGSLSTEGGAINFVAPNAWLTLEVRQPSTGTLAQAVAELRERLTAICEAYGCRPSMARHEGVADWKDGLQLAVEPAFSAPVAFDDRMVAAVERGCIEAGVTYRRMHAGTWHDAGILAAHVPTAMILVPSRGGVTHAPGEATADEDLVNGARVLLRATRHAARTVGLAANRSIRQASRPS